MPGVLSSCHTIEEWDNDGAGNFDALWTIVDEHYCFFKEKGVDWDSIRAEYRPVALKCRTAGDLFDVCASMLSTLRDGHVNLSSSFNTSYYRKWWSEYPQNYDQRLVEEYYLNFRWKTAGGMRYAILPDSIGYVRYGSFSSPVGQSNLDAVLSFLDVCPALIIDVRDNGGGNISYVEDIVSRFINRRMLAGYILHKTGPGHDDFSKPYAYYYEPPTGRPMWHKPVVVLTNRSTFSAANNFVAVMKHLPNVTIVGATTGGGSGMPLSSELPIGWTIRMSASSVLDPAGVSTESGVEPTPGHAIDLDPELALSGRDTMLDHAISYLLTLTSNIPNK